MIIRESTVLIISDAWGISVIKKKILLHIDTFVVMYYAASKYVEISKNSIVGTCFFATENMPVNKIWVGLYVGFVKNLIYILILGYNIL